MFNFIRVSAASFGIRPGDISFNTENVLRLTKEAASKGAGLIVFPSLALTGDCGSLAGHSAVRDKEAEAVNRVIGETVGLNILIVLETIFKRTLFISKGREMKSPAFALSGLKVPVGTADTITVMPSKDDFYAGSDIKIKNKLSYISENKACVYAGASLAVYENGHGLAYRSYTEDGELIFADIDGDIIAGEYQPDCNFDVIEIPDGQAQGLIRLLRKNPFFPDDKTLWPEFCKDILSIQSKALADRIRHISAKKAVINVSGGLDSTWALVVLASAMDYLDRPRTDIIGLSLPGFGTTGRTKNNAWKLMEALGTSAREINIHEACTVHFKDIGLDPSDRSVTYENAQARERTQIAMDIANKENGIMVGTGDMSELALGFSTFNGDHMSMYNPNAGLTKTGMREAAKYAADSGLFGREASHVIMDVLNTPVSPELLPPDGNTPQLTEDFVGPYELHDIFMYHMIKEGLSKEKTAFLAERAFEGDYGLEEITRWIGVFTRRFAVQQFKRSCMPEGPDILGFSFSKGGFTLPGNIAANVLELK